MDKIKRYFESIYSSVPFWKIIALLGVIEILSFAGYAFPFLNPLFCAVLLLATLVIAVRNLHYGLLIILLDLVMNSKGYLFYLPLGNFHLSIRLGIFLAVFCAYIITLVREKEIRFFHWPLWKPYCAFMLFVAIAAMVGVIRGNAPSNVFFDANGYLYFGLIFPFVQSIRSRKEITQFFGVLFAAATALIIKTILLLFIFSHLPISDDTYIAIYRWIRETGVGEVTTMGNGFVRIFFQSHMYVVYLVFLIGIWFAYFGAWKERARLRDLWPTYLLFSFALLTVFLVYSRSFWVGSAVTVMIAFGWFAFKERMSFKRLCGIGVAFIATFLVMYSVALGIINFPLPGGKSVGATSLISERTTELGSESAASSRFNLLKPLWAADMIHPIVGSGLGTTVTYTSADPRILEEHPDGRYTTYAFEWGYLDLLLKFGLVGLLVYGYLILLLLYYGLRLLKQYKESDQRVEVIGMMLTVIALLGTHFFTPYLNHPLGIGWLIFFSVYVTTGIEKENERETVEEELLSSAEANV